MEWNLRKLGLNKKSKILNLTHAFCTDGTSCSIVIENCFINSTIQQVKYTEIDDVLENLHKSNFQDYDFVFITDISPKDETWLESNKIVLIDHHQTAIKFHNPAKNRYVVSEIACGALLVKKFLEKYFAERLKHLDDLIYLVNDYDLWHKKNDKSTFINELHFFYWGEKFRQRFYNGDTRLNKTEINYLRKRKKDFTKVWEDLEIADYGNYKNLKVCFLRSKGEFLNEIAEKILKEEGYDITFILNPIKNSVSVRSKMEDVNLGEVLKMVNGGGHNLAAAFSSKPEEIYKNIETVCEYIDKSLNAKKKLKNEK